MRFGRLLRISSIQLHCQPLRNNVRIAHRAQRDVRNFRFNELLAQKIEPLLKATCLMSA
jgi:hypothetical protein